MITRLKVKPSRRVVLYTSTILLVVRLAGAQRDVGTGPSTSAGSTSVAVEARARSVRQLLQRDVGAVQVDGLVGPLAGEAQLSPVRMFFPDRAPPQGPFCAQPGAGALAPKIAVDLIERQPRGDCFSGPRNITPASTFRIVVRAVGGI